LQESGEGAPFDVILSDDGYQDPRLAGAVSLLLVAPGMRPGLFDLLPGGPYREPWAAAARADLILEGPFTEPEPGPADAGIAAAAEKPRDGNLRYGGVAVHRFGRRFRLSHPKIPGRWIALAAHGDPGPFLADLARSGIHPEAVVRGRNHAPLPVSSLVRLARRFPGVRIVCTRKEAVRLEGSPLPPESIAVAEQAIDLEAETLAFLAIRCGLNLR
jgi:tetraacyldisaccharide 4'-kinase